MLDFGDRTTIGMFRLTDSAIQKIGTSNHKHSMDGKGFKKELQNDENACVSTMNNEVQ